MIKPNYDNKTLIKAKNIKLIVMDMDGVMTDGIVGITEQANHYRNFYALDGAGLKLVKKLNDFKLAIVTASPLAELSNKRKNELNVDYLITGTENKLNAVQEIIKQCNLSMKQVIFVGDDVIDINPIKHVGLGIAVKNAHYIVKQHADYVCQNSGGKGAIREVCDLVLQAQNKFTEIYKSFE